MGKSATHKKSPLTFFLLVFGLSIPFWILAAIAGDLKHILPAKLPISALMTFCPLIAATILVYKERKINGVKELLKLSFDFKKIKNPKWYIPIVFLIPVMVSLAYGYRNMTGAIVLEPQSTLLSISGLFVMFFIGAIGEELGWSGYITEPLQNRYGALIASIVLGFVWALWHIIPYCQMHQIADWILWQCIATVCLRIIMVWLFDNTGKSVFAMVVFHTMINLSPFLIPNNGPYFGTFIFAVLLMLTVAIVICLSDPKTLIKYRF